MNTLTTGVLLCCGVALFLANPLLGTAAIVVIALFYRDGQTVEKIDEQLAKAGQPVSKAEDIGFGCATFPLIAFIVLVAAVLFLEVTFDNGELIVDALRSLDGVAEGIEAARGW